MVGCAVLRAATLEGWKCCLLESECHLLSHASGSNSGIACTGVDATPGTLERALIRDSNSMFRIYCKTHNVPTRPCGSLVCAWPWDDEAAGGEEEKKEERGSGSGSGSSSSEGENQKKEGSEEDYENDNLNKVFDESYEANDTHVRKLSSSQILQSLEPNLSPCLKGGVHIPGEIVVDPWLYSISLAIHARENGATIHTNSTFDSKQSHFDPLSNVWNVVFTQKKSVEGDGDSKGIERTIQAKAVVNAAGLWSDTVQQQSGASSNSKSNNHKQNSKMWTAKPRRGQYRIYSSNDKTAITHPIQPIPTQRTKGIFVFSSYYNQIVVGPTALDQESKTDRSIDPIVAKELDLHVKRIIPSINTDADCIGEYVGVRPGTDKRDYQIHLYPKKNWVAVAGIRSTGLTASLGIGNYVVRNLHVILDDDDDEKSRLLHVSTTPLPPLDTLIENYQMRDDGCVTINGFEYKVTHPLTRLGWSAAKLHDSHAKSKL